MNTIRIFKDGLMKLLRFGSLGQAQPALIQNPVHVAGGASLSMFGIGHANGLAVSNVIYNVDTLYAVPFVSPMRGGLAQFIVCNCNAIGGNVRLGIYANVKSEAEMYPGALVWESQPHNVVVVSDQALIANVQLEPLRLYWATWLWDQNKSMQSKLQDSLLDMLGISFNQTTTWNNLISVAQAYGALPDPFPGGAAFSSSAAALIKIRFGG